jgi:hypothetical protein
VLISYNSQAEDGLHSATAISAGLHVAISNAMVLSNGVNASIGTTAPIVLLYYVPWLKIAILHRSLSNNLYLNV